MIATIFSSHCVQFFFVTAMTHHHYRPGRWQTSHVSRRLKIMTHWEMKHSFITSPEMANNQVGTYLLAFAFIFCVFLRSKRKELFLPYKTTTRSDTSSRRLDIHNASAPVSCGIFSLLVAFSPIALVCSNLSSTTSETPKKTRVATNVRCFIGHHMDRMSIPIVICGVIKMLCDCPLDYYAPKGLVCSSMQLALLLILLCGDVEVNPGPYKNLGEIIINC